jgi:predicted solute-binding protein
MSTKYGYRIVVGIIDDSLSEFLKDHTKLVHGLKTALVQEYFERIKLIYNTEGLQGIYKELTNLRSENLSGMYTEMTNGRKK